MLFGLVLSFAMLAPQKLGGLNLAATGLALKMVVAQVIEVNLGLWFNARYLRLSYWKLLSNQIYVVGPLAGISWLVAVGVDLITHNPLFALLTSGVLYALGCIAFLFLFPSVFSFTRLELQNQVGSLARRLRR
jgi:hypothetical protein